MPKEIEIVNGKGHKKTLSFSEAKNLFELEKKLKVCNWKLSPDSKFKYENGEFVNTSSETANKGTGKQAGSKKGKSEKGSTQDPH